MSYQEKEEGKKEGGRGCRNGSRQRAPAALAEDPSLNPSNHIGLLIIVCNSSSRELVTLFWILGVPAFLCTSTHAIVLFSNMGRESSV